MSRTRWAARSGLALLTVGGVGAIAMPAAQAATTGVVSIVESQVVKYVAAAGRANRVVLTMTGATMTIDDVYGLKAGAGCKAVKGDSTKVTCTPTGGRPVIWSRVYLGDGNDTIVNNSGRGATIDAGAGNDRITSGPSSDNVLGGPGNDAIWGNAGGDRIDGGPGNDAISGGDHDDILLGGSGHDRIYGGNGMDQLTGGPGNDLEDGGNDGDKFYNWTQYAAGTDSDTFIGGAGLDIVQYTSRKLPLTVDIDGATGDDGTAGERDTVTGTIEGVVGGAGNDRLIGGPNDNALYGREGDDVIAGGDGNDLIEGGRGRDYLSGGAGNDNLTGDDPYGAPKYADRIFGGTGRDLVSYANYEQGVRVDLRGSNGNAGRAGEGDWIAADLEKVYGSYGNDVIIGNAADNYVSAFSGDDVIYGGDGNDHLESGFGANRIYGENGDDEVLATGGTLDGGPNATAAGDACPSRTGMTVVNCERLITWP
ncbi:calcium-binding protein [Paractinoplanes lichenicola]|uniref:Hemolysin type calcium-binding protein n=1 Tax=Paractinoplanes lichenicola TaxID=2802976 RepID=A0ABS1W535_9ACTN|nr:calcium-binding protein [Actinoplanes lichenicola]MBL7261855.1 hypothetical protein [Actinoplanes lichenicola]